MFLLTKIYYTQVLVRNIPPDPDESVSELVEHFFLVNHPDHYLTHQVGSSCFHLHFSNGTFIYYLTDFDIMH